MQHLLGSCCRKIVVYGCGDRRFFYKRSIRKCQPFFIESLRKVCFNSGKSFLPKRETCTFNVFFQKTNFSNKKYYRAIKVKVKVKLKAQLLFFP